MPRAPDTLVFSGGGPDGVSFLGCLRALEEMGLITGDLKTVIGCSAGSIAALFVAMRVSSVEVETWLRLGIASGDLTEIDMGGVWSMASGERLGLDDGERVIRSIRRALLPEKKDDDDDDDEDKKEDLETDLTFVELAKRKGIDLRISAACLEDTRGVLLGMDTTPDLSVFEAVRMSISVPLLFTPVRYGGKTYVDGGLYDYCPAAHIEEHIATRTIVFRISNETPTVDPLTPMAYIQMLTRAFMMHEKQKERGRRHGAHERALSCTSVETIDVPSLAGFVSFDLPSMTVLFPGPLVDRMIEHGRSICLRHLRSSSD